MTQSPAWKVYTPEGKYEAATHHAETAAAVVALLGEGATIRHGHSQTVWTEGQESVPASESYDTVAQTVQERVRGRTP